MAVADCHGLPVAVSIESATPHEVKLAESTLVQMVIPEPPQNLIGDNATTPTKEIRDRTDLSTSQEPQKQNTRSKTPATVSQTLED
jgi:hypothetical protein